MLAPTVATMIVPFIVSALGLVIYFASANPKISEAGKIAYFSGLFWLVFMFAKNVISF
jgi:hypothetical protein